MSTIVTGASGTTYITGTGSSDFDYASLIEEAYEVKMANAYLIDDQIDVLESEVSGYEEMLSDLTDLSDAAETLSAAADDSVFAQRSAYLSSSSISDPGEVIGTTVTEEAELGVYTIEVKSLATAHKVASDAVTDKTAALGYEGTLTLSEDSGAATGIVIASDMSLADIAEAINDVSGESGVTATLIKSSDSGYTLVLTSADTGQSIAATDTSGSVLQDLGIIDSSGDFADELQAAGLAELTIDGVTVTSSSNDIEDVLPGVSISLYDDTAGSTITLEVGQDLDSVYEAIEALVDAYNTYRSFALINQETDSDGAVDDAVLFGDSLLRSANSALYALLGSSVEVDGETYMLSDMGITYADDNTLEIDEDALEEFLIQHADVAEAFFQQSTSVSDSDLYVGDIAGDMEAGAYTVEITVDADGNVAGATIDGVALEVSDQTLKGVEGTAYEGLRLVYTGGGDNAGTTDSITLTVEAGLADQMVATLESYVDEDDGRIRNRIDSLESTIGTKQDKRDRIEERADAYYDYLVEYYAKLQTAMEEAETSLALIEALFGSDDDS
ncbi:flagellar filament capping protein FliD [Oleispirillum naphthae]|uniref:flagellar filament capping protein FliD n=1 Tax=Oleispirillum naphthae TaxID=2838853 RepID=UPI0030825462